MLETIGLKEDKIQRAIAELGSLKETLNGITITNGKETGGSGYACDGMESVETAVGNAKTDMQTLISATVTFLEGVKTTFQTADKESAKKLERNM